jgi:ubiquinone/menaquinone biosynthesis C-methylase UbiE
MKKYLKEEIEFENKIAKDYNHLYHNSPIDKKQIEQHVKYAALEIKPKDKVLDLGCGAASIWYSLKKIKDIEITGLDVSPAMIKEAKKLYHKANFIIGNSEKLPFKDESFDVVLVSSVLHHLPEPDKSFKEIRRVLKPYGKLIGREPQNDQYIKEADPYLSGAIMMLMHMVRRREKTILTHEPPIHEFHQSYNLESFIGKLGQYFVVKDVKSVWPFSSFFNKIKSATSGNLILKTDDYLANHKGTNFLYLAIKDGYGKTEVLSYVNTYLKRLNQNNKKPPLKFIRRLIWLTAWLDLILPKR